MCDFSLTQSSRFRTLIYGLSGSLLPLRLVILSTVFRPQSPLHPVCCAIFLRLEEFQVFQLYLPSQVRRFTSTYFFSLLSPLRFLFPKVPSFPRPQLVYVPFYSVSNGDYILFTVLRTPLDECSSTCLQFNTFSSSFLPPLFSGNTRAWVHARVAPLSVGGKTSDT